ncbi:MAG: phosphodiester glycosidase family protein [Clostridia bacterium]|nr:phosphodiester glycosidase family protein [Clostridia bacterium]MBR0408172.1 phosphodiester glycosidase family protein [Clostridia bacterium]
MRNGCKGKTLFLLFLTFMLTVTGAFPAFALETELHGYSKSGGYEYVEFGSYPTDADGTVRPILWRVLKADSNEAWLLSEYVLFGSPVHGDYEHYQGWEKSDLYMYLNSVFINDAFTAEERAALVNRTEDNALVTLITSDEMKDASIGFSSNNARLCESTAYAKILPDPPIFELPSTNNKGRWKPLYVYSKGKKYSPWWSRTRSTDYPHEQRRVMDEGKIGRISTGNSDLGVRPTVYVNLSLLSLGSGNGTKDAPYQLLPSGGAPIAQTPLTIQQPLPIVEATTEPVAQTIVPEQSDGIPIIDFSDEQSDEFLTDDPDLYPAGSLEIVGDDFYPTGDDDGWDDSSAQTGLPVYEQPADQQGFTGTVDPSTLNEHFPALTAQGFLPDGQSEFVYANEAEGLWLYASQTLRIEIKRYEGKNSTNGPLRWYEAEVFAKDNSELFDFYPFDKDHYKSYGDRYKALPEKIAQQHQLVFAINSDYFIYRIERDHEESYDYPIGVIIRDGEVFYDRPKKANSTVYPPLDVMALYPDGSVSLHKNATVTAKELLANGATDTLSFGPILVENGEVSPRSKEFGNTPNPRTGFGIAEPGHYIVVVAEGKRKGVTEGESCIWLGEKMAELGCTSAINLDGGATSVLIFMGNQLNVTGNYNSSTNRKQNELFGIGHSSAIQ